MGLHWLFLKALVTEFLVLVVVVSDNVDAFGAFCAGEGLARRALGFGVDVHLRVQASRVDLDVVDVLEEGDFALLNRVELDLEGQKRLPVDLLQRQ